MIKRKSRYEISLMKQAGHIVALVHEEMKKVIKPGMSTKQLDDIAYQIIKDNKAIPSCKGYQGFPGTICASVNDQVVHGIPSDKIIVKEGDIISIDLAATYHGMVADSARTFPVGEINDDVKKLLEVTEKALYAGIAQAKANAPLLNVSAAIEDVANVSKLGIVREYGGHGVGSSMHEDPFIFNYRTNSREFILKQGMTIAIEPMFNLGCDEVHTLEDNWTVVTNDGKPSAHFEHTVLVTDGEPVIITQL